MLLVSIVVFDPKVHGVEGSIAVKLFTDLPFHIKEAEVLRLQRVAQPTDAVGELLADTLSEGYRLAKPMALCTWVKVGGMEPGSLLLEGGYRLGVGGKGHWERAEHMALAICTIGTQLEERVSELFQAGDYASALMLDCAGSVAVESVADRVNSFICERAKELVLKVSPRSSPGYGRWSLEEQRVLFSMLPAEQIGISLNQQCMMIPRKSISFCVGVGKELDPGAHPCRRCGLADCPYRRSKP